MFNSLMPSLNIRSLPFVVFMGGFPSRLQNLSSGAIRPGGLLFDDLMLPHVHVPTVDHMSEPMVPRLDAILMSGLVDA